MLFHFLINVYIQNKIKIILVLFLNSTDPIVKFRVEGKGRIHIFYPDVIVNNKFGFGLIDCFELIKLNTRYGYCVQNQSEVNKGDKSKYILK